MKLGVSLVIVAALALLTFAACGKKHKVDTAINKDLAKIVELQPVELEKDLDKMTPEERYNFLNYVEDGYYDDIDCPY